MTLLTALVGNPDVQLASKAAGVSRSTAFRWMRQPAFQEELTRQRDAVLCETLATVKTHAVRAVATLVGLLSVKDDRLRRQVCNDILDRAMKVRELEDLERRLVALEKAMEKNTNRRQA
jgi:c-di-GMP-related signal transduction protein